MDRSKKSSLTSLSLAARPGWQVDGLLIVITLIWGSTFLVVKETLLLCGPFIFLALRFTFGGLTMALLFRRRLARLTKAELKAGLIIGLVAFGAYAFQTVGLQFTSASKAGFITGLYVPLVPLLSVFLLRQKPALGAVIGVMLSVVGLFLLSVNDDFNFQIGLGEWLMVGAAICAALHIVSVSKFAPKSEPLNLTMVQIWVVAVLSLLAAPLSGERLVLPPLPVWGATLFMGVLATALALAVMNRVQQFVSSTRATLIYALEPVFAGLCGYLAGETLSLPAWIGCGLILLGMLCAELKPSRLPLLRRLSSQQRLDTI
jgi:drug/metabolite transporter (DMT)-like permease